MVGKNNHKEQVQKNAEKNTRFSLKKLSVGVASVAVGASLLVGNVASAQGEDAPTTETTELDQILATVKSRAYGVIDGHSNLSAQLKSAFKIDVENASSVEAVEKVVDQAEAKNKELASQNDGAPAPNQGEVEENKPVLGPNHGPEEAKKALAEAKEKALASVDSLENLSAQLKSTFKVSAEDATTIDEVEKVVEQAKAKNAELTPKKSDAELLAETKEQALASIDELQSLSAQLKSTFKVKVENASSAEEVLSIVKDADETDAKLFEENKEELGPNHGPDEAYETGSEVEGDNNHAEELPEGAPAEHGEGNVQGNLPEANVKPELSKEEALKLYKEHVLEELKSLGYDNEFYLKQLEKANTKEGFDSLLKLLDINVSKKGEGNYQVELPEANVKPEFGKDRKEVVKELDKLNLSDLIKEEYAQKIKDADSDEKAVKVLAEASDLSALNDKKDEALVEIDRTNLHVNDSNELKGRIELASSVEEVDELLKEAKKREEEQGNKAQHGKGTEAEKEEGQVPEEDKKDDKKDEDKKDEQQSKLDKVKEEAKKEILNLPNLSKEQKDKLLAGVSEAKTLADVHEILAFARGLNKDQKPAEKKEEAKKEEKKKGERLPDTATGAWALGLVGASSLLAGAGIKKFKK